MGNLRAIAINAYNESDTCLPGQNAEAIRKVEDFLAKLNCTASIDSLPFQVDGIFFSVTTHEDQDGIYGYGINAFYACSYCKQSEELEDIDFDGKFTAAMFGEWLTSHSCSYKNRRIKFGFLG